MIVKHILEHVGADILRYHPVGIGEVLMDQLRPCYKALGGKLRGTFIEHKLEIFM